MKVTCNIKRRHKTIHNKEVLITKKQNRIDFARFGLESRMVFEETTGMYKGTFL